ncbi:ABC transporter ATP-binding protein [Streptococcus gallolyticus]|nr:ABC transporter ATP-binding protein [Streptococcus gallolyticus]
MVLAQNHILILDEPTRHFSPTSQPLIRELLRNFNGCIISVSHDRKFIDDIANLRYQLTDKELQKY